MPSSLSICTALAIFVSANIAVFDWTGGAALARTKSSLILRRVDWQVTGSSCATCLIRLEKKLKAAPGVIKAAVSIYKPFNAALVYDQSKTSWAEISKTLGEEKVGAAALKEISLDDVPLVLEPR